MNEGVTRSEGLPLVSVIIPTYNRWPMVCESIDSALAQDYPALEVIVVDDGSTDGTDEKLAERYGDRVRYIWQENQRQAAARNTGIEAASGDLIAFLDSDDLWLPGKLQAQVRSLQAAPEAGFSYTICLNADARGNPTNGAYGDSALGHSGDLFETMLHHEPVILPSMVVWRPCLIDVGMFDEEQTDCEDTELILRLALAHRAKFVNEPFVLIRQHEGRGTYEAIRTGTRARSQVRMYRKLLRVLPPSRDRMRSAIARRIAEARFLYACAVYCDRGHGAAGIVRDAIAANWVHLHRYFPFMASVRLLDLTAEGSPSLQARRVESLASWFLDSRNVPLLARRWRAGLMYCAASRHEFTRHRFQTGRRWALAALRTHAGCFCRHLLPTLPRGLHALIRRLINSISGNYRTKHR